LSAINTSINAPSHGRPVARASKTMAGQRFLVIEHRAEIAHIKLSAARVAFAEMLGFAQRRAASLLAR